MRDILKGGQGADIDMRICMINMVNIVEHGYDHSHANTCSGESRNVYISCIYNKKSCKIHKCPKINFGRISKERKVNRG